MTTPMKPSNSSPGRALFERRMRAARRELATLDSHESAAKIDASLGRLAPTTRPLPLSRRSLRRALLLNALARSRSPLAPAVIRGTHVARARVRPIRKLPRRVPGASPVPSPLVAPPVHAPRVFAPGPVTSSVTRRDEAAR
jgi:hypothetical protein